MQLRKFQRVKKIALSAVAIVAVNGVSLWLTSRLPAKISSVAQSREILSDSEELEKSLVLAETQQRGYLITRKLDYMSGYEAERRAVASLVAKLYKSTATRNQSLERLRNAQIKIDEKFNEMDKTLSLANRGKQQEALNLVRRDVGRVLMTEIIGELDSLEAIEKGVLRERISNRDMALSQDRTFRFLQVFVDALAMLWLTNEFFHGSWTKKYLEGKMFERTKELVLAKNNLSAMLDRERELSQLRARLITTISHQFKTPLAAIKTAAKLLSENIEAPIDKRKQWAGIISNEVSRLDEMVIDVLSLQKTGKEFVEGSVNLTALIEEVIERLHVVYSDCRVMICSSSFPNQILGDESLLTAAFENLISNAIKYSPPLSLVKVEINQSESEYYIFVIDEGVGIPEEDMPYLFCEFHRAENVENISGTGVGLAIAKKCINLHDGTIEVDSTEGKGTTFVVKIPVKVLAPAPTNGSEQRARA